MSDISEQPRMSTELEELIRRSIKEVAAMPPELLKEMYRKQAEGYAHAEASWLAPRFKVVDGVKVYESYEDY